MGIMESIQGGISRAIYKGIKHAGTALAGVATALLLKHLNFPLSEEHQLSIAVAVTGLLGTLLKMIKDKFKLAWL